MTSEPRTPSRQRRLAGRGATLAVTEYDGDGPPLVLLHGIGSRGVSWWPVVDALAANVRLYALDLRGHGASDRPAAGYLFPDYAADLAAVVDGLDLARPAVLGHSLGGLVALTWAADHPDGAAALVVEDPSLRTVPGILTAFDGWMALNALSVEEAAAVYRREHPDWTDADCRRRAESITAVAPAVFAELRADAAAVLAAADGRDRIAPLAAIRCPVLLVHGDPETGGMVAPADADRLVATLPDVRLVRIPGGGHDLHRERTEAFLAAVVPFLRKFGAAGATVAASARR